MRRLREVNMATSLSLDCEGERHREGREQDSVCLSPAAPPSGPTPVCVCGHPLREPLLRCRMCQARFHASCVPFSALSMPASPVCWWDWDPGFLCPLCRRSRRPRLETILALLVALQKLPVRLPEGEALQCLTERAVSWQGRVRSTLQSPDLQGALETLRELREGKGGVQDLEDGSPSHPDTSAVTANRCENGHGAREDPDNGTGKARVTGSKWSWAPAQKHTTHILMSPPPGVEALLHLLPSLQGPVIQLSPSAVSQLEELQLEGDLLEVTLDQTLTIHWLLQASSRPPLRTLRALITVRHSS